MCCCSVGYVCWQDSSPKGLQSANSFVCQYCTWLIWTKLMGQDCFEVDCPWHKEIFSMKYKAKNRGKDKICSRAMTGESLAMMSLTRPHLKKIQMGRNLACVFCSGKQYLDNVLRSECQVYEFKQKVHTFENLAAGRTTWEQVILVARSWMWVLLWTEPSQVSAAQRKTAFCGSPAWARTQPKERGKEGAGEEEEVKTLERAFFRTVGACAAAPWWLQSRVLQHQQPAWLCPSLT